MAREIQFRADPEKGEIYGEEVIQDHKGNITKTLNCVALLMEDGKEIARTIIQGIPMDEEAGRAYRDAEAQKLLDNAPSAAPVVSKDDIVSAWPVKITKTAAIE
jgi:hypothetical protein